jgi:dolichol-phosphate mannosyltransferase
MKTIVSIMRWLLLVTQAVLAVRSFGRMARTASGSRIRRVDIGPVSPERVTVLLPVRYEEARLRPCIQGLLRQGPEVAEILVIDGGSADGTRSLVHSLAERDMRIQLIDATPVPEGVNGKAHNLQAGLRLTSTSSEWILTVDADVRPGPNLVRSLLAFAEQEEIAAFSVATQQTLSGAGEGFVHPSMLATLVYRFGIPGTATTDPDDIQANGQCFMARRDILESVDGFTRVIRDVSEDATLARLIARSGQPVGFYESDDLVSVEMYAGWRDAWDNWTRSLPMRDRFTERSSGVRLLEATFVQALPTWLAPYFAVSLGRAHPATMLNLGLLIGRLGVLAGMSRAYRRRPWTYWISPLADIAVVARIWQMWGRRVHTWRGRALVTGDHS